MSSVVLSNDRGLIQYLLDVMSSVSSARHDRPGVLGDHGRGALRDAAGAVGRRRGRGLRGRRAGRRAQRGAGRGHSAASAVSHRRPARQTVPARRTEVTLLLLL